MKKSELDLSKVHVDQFGDEDKSWDGLSLALTKAGWATVTKDGTIVEVLDAFQASKPDVTQAFEDRGDIPTGTEFAESDLDNPKDIGSAGVDGDSVITGSGPAPVNPTFTVTPNADFLLDSVDITITTPGSGLTDGTIPLVISAPDASTAVLSGFVANTAGVPDSDQSALISDGGIGYGPTAPTITQTGGTGSGATFTPVISGGVLTGISVIGGTGYVGDEELTITAPDTEQAIGTVTISGGIADTVTITFVGEGYVTATVTV